MLLFKKYVVNPMTFDKSSLFSVLDLFCDIACEVNFQFALRLVH